MTRYTKAHYEELARIILDAAHRASNQMFSPSEGDLAARTYEIIIVRTYCERMARTFALDNPRFDADLWFKACGVERGVR